MDTLAAALTHRDRIVRLRHELHAHPELGLDLPLTQARVLTELEDLDVEITTGVRCTSVTAVLRGTGSTASAGAPAVLLRADMDALAVDEATGLPWASQVPGVMHACGHDLHTAMLAGAARILAEHRDELPGDVVFMFQPGEEMHDGAAVMIEEGVLDAAGNRVDAAFGLHVMSAGMPHGELASREGPMMAAADGLTVTVRGRGGHSSAPHRAVDPVTIACEMVLALQTYVTRRFDVFDPIVVGVGAIHAGDLAAPNAIPDTATFAASVRFWSEDARARFHQGADDLLTGIAHAHGADVNVDHVNGYPVTVTDPAETQFAQRVIGKAFGENRFRIMTNPLSGSEDFSRVLSQVPGSFIVLGATPLHLDPATAANNHSPHAQFDDSLLAVGVAVYAELAWRRLTEAVPARPEVLAAATAAQ